MSHPAWLYHLETCESTNTWAIAHLADLQHGDVVFTPQQTAGRGQQGRIWRSPFGVLTMSIVLRDLPIDCFGYFSLWAGVAVVEAIKVWLPDLRNIGVKWPNDVWWGDRKLAGLLAETTLSPGQTTATVVLGLGLNYTVDFATIAVAGEWGWPERIGSLFEQSQPLPEVGEAIAQLRANFLQIAYLSKQPSDMAHAVMIAKVNDLDVMRDRPMTLEMGEQGFVGIGAGVNAGGAYQLRLPTGELIVARSGRLRVDVAR